MNEKKNLLSELFLEYALPEYLFFINFTVKLDEILGVSTKQNDSLHFLVEKNTQ
jgi:hypothetical protein